MVLRRDEGRGGERCLDEGGEERRSRSRRGRALRQAGGEEREVRCRCCEVREEVKGVGRGGG